MPEEIIARPKILIACFPLGSGSGAVRGSTVGGDVLGCAMTEDGEVLADHLSSGEDYCRHDMGLTSDWKHDRYLAYAFPDGYELVWVGRDYQTHPGWLAALALNRASWPEAQETVNS